MKRVALIGILFLAACHHPQKETVTTTPSEPARVATPSPSPSPATKQTGWIQIQADRWQRATVRPEKQHFVVAIAAQITRNRSRYEVVSKKTGVPWEVIGCIHSLEGSLNFRTNLGQGDPLTAQSRHVPRGRPPIPPKPPFSWEYAAEDSLKFDGLDKESWKPIAQELQNIEAWNGTGYQRFHPDVPSQYLWSWSSIEKPGKYVADGQWSPTARSQQAGAAMILKELP